MLPERYAPPYIRCCKRGSIMRIFIAVAHLLGAGHLTRAAALGRAFVKLGHDVTLATGGAPTSLANTDGLTIRQIPPVKADGLNFKTLLDGTERVATVEYLALREEKLLDLYRAAPPDILITELFPFGRRLLMHEFRNLLELARTTLPRPLVLASIRDILATPTVEGRVDETHALLRSHYDGVLVHSDPTFIALDTSWPRVSEIADLIHYTGFIDENGASAGSWPREGIVVSGGSSLASLPLYRAALYAARQIPHRRWTILIGRNIPDGDFTSLQNGCPDNAFVERARPDFRAMLARAELSISQAGYNTVIDLLNAAPRALLVPFEAGGETEQMLRAKTLVAHGFGQILREGELSPDVLAALAEEALNKPLPPCPDVNLNGAAQSASLALTLFKEKRAVSQRLLSALWRPLDDALARAAGLGKTLSFWWRDDDAATVTEALERLLALRDRFALPLALAAIPERFDPSLADRISEILSVRLMVHGWRHKNHAAGDVKKAEFGADRALGHLTVDALNGLKRMQETINARHSSLLIPVFVPPWNRIAGKLVPQLPHLGFTGLSTFGDRPPPVPGLRQINCHIDPVDWRKERSLVPQEAIIATLVRAITERSDGATDEPIGILTHHLVHDEAIWEFCEALLERLPVEQPERSGVIQWPRIGDLWPVDRRN